MNKKEPQENKPEAENHVPPTLKLPSVAPFDDVEEWFEGLSPRSWMQPFLRRAWHDIEGIAGPKLPRVDIIEYEEEIIVRAEIPGVAREDLEITLSGGTLTLHGKPRHELAEEVGNFHRRELSRGEFERALRLPCDVDGDRVRAHLRDGLLELTLPKSVHSKRQSIQVE